MDLNFCWQPYCLQVMSDFSTNAYLDQFCVQQQLTSPAQPTFEELKKKCEELELENSHLKQELSILKNIRVKRGKKRVRRRTQQELDKKFRCFYTNCKKDYASSLALNLHIKTKHKCSNTRKTSDQEEDGSLNNFFVKDQQEPSNNVENKRFSRKK